MFCFRRVGDFFHVFAIVLCHAEGDLHLEGDGWVKIWLVASVVTSSTLFLMELGLAASRRGVFDLWLP